MSKTSKGSPRLVDPHPTRVQRAPLTVGRSELLVDGSDRDFRRLVHNLFALAARHEAIRDGHAARIGLTGIEYAFVVSIHHLEDEGSVSVKRLAEFLRVSGAFATTMVGKLIRRGLVTKDEDPLDRRRLRLHVTARTHALLTTLAPSQRRVNDIQFSGLTRQEFLVFQRLIEGLIETSEQALLLQAQLGGGRGRESVGR